MDRQSFEERLAEARFLPGARDRAYRGDQLWERVGQRPADRRITALADLYREATPAQRAEIRASVPDRNFWDLVLYVRRIARLIHSADDTGWLRAGLAAACIENARFDFRDGIVSLVILRYAAERAGIETGPYFEEAIELADPDFRHHLRNARDHARSDVRLTLREFGPTDWAAECGRRERG